MVLALCDWNISSPLFFAIWDHDVHPGDTGAGTYAAIPPILIEICSTCRHGRENGDHYRIASRSPTAGGLAEVPGHQSLFENISCRKRTGGGTTEQASRGRGAIRIAVFCRDYVGISQFRVNIQLWNSY